MLRIPKKNRSARNYGDLICIYDGFMGFYMEDLLGFFEGFTGPGKRSHITDGKITIHEWEDSHYFYGKYLVN